MSSLPSVAIIGFGAFGQLVARHLRGRASLCICDPQVRSNDLPQVDSQIAARCDVIILAVPLSALRGVLSRMADHLRPGALVIDVCSVKIQPARMMQELLPDHVDLVCSHPLFGPRSAPDGLAGHRIAWCPLRGPQHLRAVALMRRMGLRVIRSTPDSHDREMAIVQGLTHLIARGLSDLGPLPDRLTTASYRHLMQAVAMVQDDSPALLHTILSQNPHAETTRSQFLDRINGLAQG
ncbi:prephenate dehydrogenase [Paracoccus fistulariae]|uniref:Prephenate dehydrogenase n=1 Tax=Paracoccus fistulariae TaxID=658446 RepID=A0ABY7SFQ3_9RHOB|nr:prephenate dehydrogenase [Paracoccus fistulariae]MDB6182744.1 prephenate dehydrogenase [Paracoccus fistulariae]WCR05694.1 prephenate dehydrogenase [Paracoccus fistulariae]